MKVDDVPHSNSRMQMKITNINGSPPPHKHPREVRGERPTLRESKFCLFSETGALHSIASRNRAMNIAALMTIPTNAMRSP